MNALFVLRPAKLRAFNFGHPCPSLVKGEVLSPDKIRATTGGIATPPSLASHQPLQNRTIPLTFRNANICMCRYAFTSALNLPPLSKVRCCRPIKFGRRPEGLPHLPHPFRFSDTSVNNPSVTVTENVILRQHIFYFNIKQY